MYLKPYTTSVSLFAWQLSVKRSQLSGNAVATTTHVPLTRGCKSQGEATSITLNLPNFLKIMYFISYDVTSMYSTEHPLCYFRYCVNTLWSWILQTAIRAVLSGDGQTVVSADSKEAGLRGKLKKVVLAYSGGLDTSVIVPWLKYVFFSLSLQFISDL